MRTIRTLIYENVELLDVAGPLGVFAMTSEWAHLFGETDNPCYQVELISLTGGLIMTASSAAVDTRQADVQDVHTLVIPGALGKNLPTTDPALLAWVKSQAVRAQRVCAIGTGSLILAATGLLAGHRATTHWAYIDELARDCPGISVVTDAVFVIDGPYWTSGGVLAGIDLAMAVVEVDYGRRMADYVARRMVAKSRRAVGETQLSAHLIAQETEVGRIRKLMEWIAENPTADLSVAALAEQTALSRSSFHRHFKRETQLTPAEFVERARVNAARRLIARTDYSLQRVAMASGFNSAMAMRRAFIRCIGVPPAEYRKTINPAG